MFYELYEGKRATIKAAFIQCIFLKEQKKLTLSFIEFLGYKFGILN